MVSGMKLIATHTHKGDFEPLHATGSSQAAMMTLQPGDTTGEASGNEHAWAEQWCFVVQGEGQARTKGKKVALRPGSLLLIEKGEPHQIENTGAVPLVTFNIYAPPAYDKQGEPLY
jgi:mannose-6-phosphate isomerase-like protein (cupin superfamily)